MAFDKHTDSLAITVPWFELKRSADGARAMNWHYNEPYIVSFAIDAHGRANPALHFNVNDFPNVQRGDRVEMLGHGHLLYGPKQPGEFVAVSVLVMENDQGIRDLGAAVEEIASGEAIKLGVETILAANPTASAVTGILQKLTDLVGSVLKQNKDDRLLRAEGVFLRDAGTPYGINRIFVRRNNYVDLAVKVLPLDSGNGEGTSVRALTIR